MKEFELQLTFFFSLAIGRCRAQAIGTIDASAPRAVANQSFATNSSNAEQLWLTRGRAEQ